MSNKPLDQSKLGRRPLRPATTTPDERVALAQLAAAVVQLPKTLKLHIDELESGALLVYKKAQPHVHTEVARITCQTLD